MPITLSKPCFEAFRISDVAQNLGRLSFHADPRSDGMQLNTSDNDAVQAFKDEFDTTKQDADDDTSPDAGPEFTERSLGGDTAAGTGHYGISVGPDPAI